MNLQLWQMAGRAILVCAVAVTSAVAQAAPTVVTSDLRNFYRAFDLAQGRDSAERVRIFEREYIRAGSPGLRDWALVRLASWDEAIMPALITAGWTMPRILEAYEAPAGDSARAVLMAALDTLVPPTAAANIAAATAARPRFYAGIRDRVLALDTAAAITDAAARGLRALAALYPEGRPKPVYIVVGRLTSGGTVGASGVLLGAEMATRSAATPVDELSETERGMVSDRSMPDWAGIIVHEAVHTFQSPQESRPLLDAVLHEGVPDFLASLALPDGNTTRSGHQQYGRANEARLWREFRRGIATKEDSGNWLYSYSVKTNHGHPDLGYFIGFRIAEGYYRQARDKRAAIRDLITLRDASRIFRLSGYAPPPATRRRAR